MRNIHFVLRNMEHGILYTSVNSTLAEAMEQRGNGATEQCIELNPFQRSLHCRVVSPPRSSMHRHESIPFKIPFIIHYRNDLNIEYLIHSDSSPVTDWFDVYSNE